MVLIFAAALFVCAALSLIFMPEFQSGTFREVWKAIAPNLAAEALGLSLAVLFAEYYLKRFRATGGKNKLAPMLMRQLGPVVKVENSIIRSTQYTPKEFKEVHAEYIKGNFNPIHIPKEFIDRLLPAIKKVPVEDFRKGAEAIRKANDFAAKFAGMLDEEALVILELAATNWSNLAAIVSSEDSEPRDVAEAYLDAHDDFNDIANVFAFKESLKRMRREI